jgi:hypothetical protein
MHRAIKSLLDVGHAFKHNHDVVILQAIRREKRKVEV